MSVNDKKHSKDFLWVALPLCFLLIMCGVVWFVHIPLGLYAITQGKYLGEQYRIKKEATQFPVQLKKIIKEKALLDSVLSEVEGKYNSNGNRLPDQLYIWADSTGFTAKTIEAGTPQKVANHIETAISITGNGSYQSIGQFIANIENSTQSTRIRQLRIKRGKTRNLEVFIDLAVREEGS
jgi:Tfp pilus assembly protein PilO